MLSLCHGKHGGVADECELIEIRRLDLEFDSLELLHLAQRIILISKQKRRDSKKIIQVIIPINILKLLQP